MKELEALFLARFQALKFDKKLENGTPSQKADILRSIIFHLKSAPYYNIVSKETSVQLIKDYEKQYESIVDCFDETKGLNNFASGALSLCTGKKNDSQKWKTSLELSRIKTEGYFTNYLERCKTQSNVKDLSQTVFRERRKLLVTESPKPLADNTKPLQPLPAYFTGGASQQNDNSRNSVFIPAQTSKNPTSSDVFSTRDITNENQKSVTKHVPPSYHSSHNQKSNSMSVYGKASSTRHDTNYFNEDKMSSRPPQPQYSQKKSLFTESSRTSKENYVENTGGSYNQRRNEWKKRNREEEEEIYEEDEIQQKPAPGPFKTARDQLAIDQQKKHGGGNRGQQYQGQGQGQVSNTAYGGVKKSLGSTRRGPSSKFIPPVLNKDEEGGMLQPNDKPGNTGEEEELVDERLKGIDPKMIELINNEIMDHGPTLTWDDVAGLEFAKKTIKEIVVWPMLRPDIFTGLRGPPKGLLLFGPPGTGKTLIGKCIASQSKSTFFCISASSLTSKWVGEGEKMVRALFAVARCNQPAVIFIDEIDSLLSQRSDNEHEASRRIKTEFLVQLDGAATISEDRILIVGATNRPQEIDEAARRRFVKRLYIPLPEDIARRQIVINLLAQQKHNLSDSDLDSICHKSDGYSGSDMANLCREAALGPIRSIPFDEIETITSEQVRAIQLSDFLESLTQVRASVSTKDLDLYINWNQLYGSFGKQ